MEILWSIGQVFHHEFHFFLQRIAITWMNRNVSDVPDTCVERPPRPDDLDEDFFAEKACRMMRTIQQVKRYFFFPKWRMWASGSEDQNN
jgi:hypothetical protein